MEINKRETQMMRIVARMIKDKEKQFFMAGDFQDPEIRVGWEASARMSDLARRYPQVVEASRSGRYRYLRFRFDNIPEMFATLPEDWTSFIRYNLDMEKIPYEIEKKVYIPVGDNTVREITKRVMVNAGERRNEEKRV